MWFSDHYIYDTCIMGHYTTFRKFATWILIDRNTTQLLMIDGVGLTLFASIDYILLYEVQSPEISETYWTVGLFACIVSIYTTVIPVYNFMYEFSFQVQYEILNKRFRLAQKSIDREISHVQNVTSELEKCLQRAPTVSEGYINT